MRETPLKRQQDCARRSFHCPEIFDDFFQVLVQVLVLDFSLQLLDLVFEIVPRIPDKRFTVHLIAYIQPILCSSGQPN
jgi:hypothetical protein